MTTDEQCRLLRWARQTIETAVQSRPLPVIPASELTSTLREPHAAFVTLKQRGDLRGCIGKMDFTRPLWENVIGAAVSAALEDPRFLPVTPAELPEINLSISVLEPPVELRRVEEFDPQRHGIIVRQGVHSALLLPKVAQEYGWGAEQVLDCVCRKAGLPDRAWREPATRFQVFTALDFAES